MSSGPQYVLTRDYLDNNRINLQHYLWIQTFRYYVHPDIDINKDDLRVADVGAGTGIWLTDLSRDVSSAAQLDAIDISFDALPPLEWLPANVKPRLWDVSTEPSDELIGVYDLVNIRLFSFVLKDEDIPDVIHRLGKLLKPGGYLQWSEPDMLSFRIEKLHPEKETPALSQLLKLSQGQDKRLSPTWVPKLPDFFQNEKFQNVQSDVRDAPMHLALATHECNLTIHEIIARKTQNEDVAKRLATLIPEAARETREGSVWAFTRWNVIGRKPVQN